MNEFLKNSSDTSYRFLQRTVTFLTYTETISSQNKSADKIQCTTIFSPTLPDETLIPLYTGDKPFTCTATWTTSATLPHVEKLEKKIFLHFYTWPLKKNSQLRWIFWIESEYSSFLRYFPEIVHHTHSIIISVLLFAACRSKYQGSAFWLNQEWAMSVLNLWSEWWSPSGITIPYALARFTRHSSETFQVTNRKYIRSCSI